MTLPELIVKISSFSKLIRVCAWVLRFISNRHPCAARISGCLTSSDLHGAIIRIVSLIKKNQFPSELKCLSEEKSLAGDCKFLSLNLFLDTNDISHVGGRVSNNCYFTYDQKHQMLLPKNYKFTNKLIMHNVTNIHTGPKLTLSVKRQNVWFVDGRSLARKQFRKCIKCLRLNLKTSPQLMKDLSATRIMQIRVFDIVEMDYTGHFYTKCAHERSVTKYKVLHLPFHLHINIGSTP